MIGSVTILIVLVVIVPVALFMSGFVATALLGTLVKNDVDRQHAGSELLELSERS
jgi:hypothetical protein